MVKDIHKLFGEFMYESEFVKKVRPATLRSYLSTFLLFMKIEQNVSLDTLTSNTMIHFFKTLQERKRIIGKGIVKTGIKKSTVATYWSKLNTFFNWLLSKRHITSNPFGELPYPTPSYEDKKFLNREEIEKIIAAIHIHHDNNSLLLKRNLLMFYMLLFCGLRREELMLLNIRDIDLERKVLDVRASASKSGRSRQIPLHSTIMMYLKDYLTARKLYSTAYLFVSSDRDDKLTLNGLKHIVQKIRNYSGVPFHVHQFRHTFAVNFLKSSNNIAKLRQLMGHKDINMTMVYLRCLPITEMRRDIENLSIDHLI